MKIKDCYEVHLVKTLKLRVHRSSPIPCHSMLLPSQEKKQFTMWDETREHAKARAPLGLGIVDYPPTFALSPAINFSQSSCQLGNFLLENSFLGRLVFLPLPRTKVRLEQEFHFAHVEQTFSPLTPSPPRLNKFLARFPTLKRDNVSLKLPQTHNLTSISPQCHPRSAIWSPSKAKVVTGQSHQD